MTVGIEDVLSFWFGELDAEGRADDAHRASWWKKDPAFDTKILERFAATREAIIAGERDDWLTSPRGRLAYIIVLDQFSRNMHRDSADMYTADHLSVGATLAGVEAGDDKTFSCDERTFFYMPLMHSEALEDQEKCVELFSAFCEELEGKIKEGVEGNVKYAVIHRDIVKRFGRFPHRNQILDRASTDEEAEFLKQPGSSF